MIGIDQEPSREILDRLQAELGEGMFQLRYAEQSNGTVLATITMIGEQVPVLKATFATNATRAQVDGVWSSAVDQFVKTRAFEREQAEAKARDYRPPPAEAGDAADDRATVDAPNAPPAPPAPEQPAQPTQPQPTPQPRPDEPPTPQRVDTSTAQR